MQNEDIPFSRVPKMIAMKGKVEQANEKFIPIWLQEYVV